MSQQPVRTARPKIKLQLKKPIAFRKIDNVCITSSISQQSPLQPPKSTPPTSSAPFKKQIRAPYPGIKNLGSTCYLNSALQVLFYCPDFRQVLSEIQSSVKENLLITSLVGLFTKMENITNEKADSYVDPEKFFLQIGKLNRNFSVASKQQDVQEFLRFLIDSIQNIEKSDTSVDMNEQNTGESKRKFNELSKDPIRRIFKKRKIEHQDFCPLDPNLRNLSIKRLFRGNLSVRTVCLECESVSELKEHFYDLSLTIEKGESLYWSLKDFTSVERLSGQNKYNCQNCRTFTEANHDLRFLKLPPVLTLLLKRFSCQNAKVVHHVPCPMSLKLSSYCHEDCKEKNCDYELFGIIFHKGSFSSCGHYISLVKICPGSESSDSLINKGDDDVQLKKQWVCFDDISVNYYTEKQVLSLLTPNNTHSNNTAYILFYKRK